MNKTKFGRWDKATRRQRFWAKVNKAGPKSPHMKSRCWTMEHTYIDKDGYAAFSFASGVSVRAHRYAFEEYVRTLLPGETVNHKCDTRKCIRPSHLYAGTIIENTNDRVVRGRQIRGEKAPKAKLTEPKVIDIRQKAASGRSARSLAKEYGVTDRAIACIVKRESWKHVA